MKAYIGIGTNIGDRAENLRYAVRALGLVPGVTVADCSRVYETKPVGYAFQDNFYNICVQVGTSLSPSALLGVCLGIEAGAGRVRGIKNGPRIIDLDLLLYEDVSMDTEELVLPHPRMGERAFVLVPLAEIGLPPQFRAAYDRLTDKDDVVPVGEL